LTEQNLADIGINQLRTPLVTVPGAAIPYPYRGKQRQVQIDLNSAALQARGLSGQDVANALAEQNLITPVGTQKIGAFEYVIQLNNSPLKVEDLGDLPIKAVNGAMVYIHDVASVRDGNSPQTNIVHVDGNRSVLMMVLKAGTVSTLDIIAGIKQKVIDVKDSLPDALKIGFVGDQSLFVRGAITGVVREGVIAALLTSVMILLFLGSWRSTLIIATSIPLAVLGAIIMLSLIGETLNIMTLGGLALAVGILVDEATVTIENINWHLEQGKAVELAIMDGATQIVTPAFVSLLCICIVFVPMFFLQGVARFLFVPMAEAVIFAMIWSFILSRTLVPTMAKYLLEPHAHHAEGEGPPPSRNPLVRFQRTFEAGCGDRRIDLRDSCNADVRAGGIQHGPQEAACKNWRCIGRVAYSLIKARRSLAGSWVFSGFWPASLRPVSGRVRTPVRNCVNGPITGPFRPWRWCCRTPRFSTPPSICRAGWRPIIARRSSRALAAT
jgi:multidrug efflux pump subunit AcrB